MESFTVTCRLISPRPRVRAAGVTFGTNMNRVIKTAQPQSPCFRQSYATFIQRTNKRTSVMYEGFVWAGGLDRDSPLVLGPDRNVWLLLMVEGWGHLLGAGAQLKQPQMIPTLPFIHSFSRPPPALSLIRIETIRKRETPRPGECFLMGRNLYTHTHTHTQSRCWSPQLSSCVSAHLSWWCYNMRTSRCYTARHAEHMYTHLHKHRCFSTYVLVSW